jgi:hypothetical protein
VTLPSLNKLTLGVDIGSTTVKVHATLHWQAPWHQANGGAVFHHILERLGGALAIDAVFAFKTRFRRSATAHRPYAPDAVNTPPSSVTAMVTSQLFFAASALHAARIVTASAAVRVVLVRMVSFLR